MWFKFICITNQPFRETLEAPDRADVAHSIGSPHVDPLVAWQDYIVHALGVVGHLCSNE